MLLTPIQLITYATLLHTFLCHAHAADKPDIISDAKAKAGDFSQEIGAVDAFSTPNSLAGTTMTPIRRLNIPTSIPTGDFWDNAESKVSSAAEKVATLAASASTALASRLDVVSEVKEKTDQWIEELKFWRKPGFIAAVTIPLLAIVILIVVVWYLLHRKLRRLQMAIARAGRETGMLEPEGEKVHWKDRLRGVQNGFDRSGRE